MSECLSSLINVNFTTSDTVLAHEYYFQKYFLGKNRFYYKFWPRLILNEKPHNCVYKEGRKFHKIIKALIVRYVVNYVSTCS